MKKRTITGVLLALFVAPFVVFGTHFIALFILLVMGIGVYELLDIKRKANMEAIPIYIFVLSMIFSFLLIFDIPYISSYAFDYKNGILPTYGLNTLWVILFIITLLASSVFDKKYSIIDAVYTFTMVMFLSLGLKGMLYVRSFGGVSNINDGTLLLLYVLITTCATDIFAYFGGMTCYRLLGTSKVHKLNERISPKKTIEGTVVGTIFGTGLGFLKQSALMMAAANDFIIQTNKDGIADDAVSIVVPDATVYVPLEELIDFAQEIERLTKEEVRFPVRSR
jgi:CDP-diglyceride synthetase